MRCEGFGCSEVSSDGIEVLGCDTVYAVNKEHFSKHWMKITQLYELLGIFDLYELPQKVDIVLTGGEPLIYAHEPLFVSFLEHLIKNGHRITFETNGSLAVDFEKYPVYKKCIFALSVKLLNSGEPYNKRIRPEVIFSFGHHAKEAFFKFSIDADSIDLALEDEIAQVTQHAAKLPVYCMPLGGNKTDVERNTEPLIEFCKSKGFCFSDRLHIRIWDENRGV